MPELLPEFDPVRRLKPQFAIGDDVATTLPLTPSSIGSVMSPRFHHSGIDNHLDNGSVRRVTPGGGFYPKGEQQQQQQQNEYVTTGYGSTMDRYGMSGGGNANGAAAPLNGAHYNTATNGSSGSRFEEAEGWRGGARSGAVGPSSSTGHGPVALPPPQDLASQGFEGGMGPGGHVGPVGTRRGAVSGAAGSSAHLYDQPSAGHQRHDSEGGPSTYPPSDSSYADAQNHNANYAALTSPFIPNAAGFSSPANRTQLDERAPPQSTLRQSENAYYPPTPSDASSSPQYAGAEFPGSSGQGVASLAQGGNGNWPMHSAQRVAYQAGAANGYTSPALSHHETQATHAYTGGVDNSGQNGYSYSYPPGNGQMSVNGAYPQAVPGSSQRHQYPTGPGGPIPPVGAGPSASIPSGASNSPAAQSAGTPGAAPFWPPPYRPAPAAPPARNFKCSACPASFARNHDLKRHARIHLAVKPFPCGYCDKSFSRKDALKRHILVKGCGTGTKKKEGDSKKIISSANKPTKAARDPGTAMDSGSAPHAARLPVTNGSSNPASSMVDTTAYPMGQRVPQQHASYPLQSGYVSHQNQGLAPSVHPDGPYAAQSGYDASLSSSGSWRPSTEGDAYKNDNALRQDGRAGQAQVQQQMYYQHSHPEQPGAYPANGGPSLPSLRGSFSYSQHYGAYGGHDRDLSGAMTPATEMAGYQQWRQ